MTSAVFGHVGVAKFCREAFFDGPMNGKEVAVEGDVGQVVAGNVVHEGAKASSQLSNVITISTGQPTPPIRKITDLQRRRINAKVKEVMDAAGIESQLDVYSIVLTDFGIQKIVDLPCEQFKPVMAMLDNWIAEERGQMPSGGQRVEQQGEHMSSPVDAIHQRLDKLQRSLRVLRLTTFGAVLMAACGAYASYAFLPRAVATPARVCHLDGKAHSIGSVVRMPDNAVYECGQSPSLDGGATWQPARNLGSGGKRRY